MNNNFLIMTILMLVFGQLICYGQKYMVVKKASSGKYIQYKSGDVIKFKLKGEDFFRKNQIVSVSDTALNFHHYTIGFREISALKLDGKRFTSFDLKNIGTALQQIGAGYIVIDQFNRVVVQGSSPDFDQGVWITGTTLFLSGIIIKLLTTKKIKIGSGYYIRVLEY